MRRPPTDHQYASCSSTFFWAGIRSCSQSYTGADPATIRVKRSAAANADYAFRTRNVHRRGNRVVVRNPI